MLQIALCDDNIDELSNMVQLIDLYRTSKISTANTAYFQMDLNLFRTLKKERGLIYTAWTLPCRDLLG